MRAFLKTVLLSSFGVTAAFFAVVHTSCNNDKCKTIVCAHNGTCSGGICACPTGYDGTQCENVTRDKFVGLYSAYEKGSSSNGADYTLSIQTDTSAVQNLWITNMYNYFSSPIHAYVSGDSIIVPSQNMQGKIVLGTGVIVYDQTYAQHATVTMRYLVIDTLTNKHDDFGYDTSDHSQPSLWDKQ